MHLNN